MTSSSFSSRVHVASLGVMGRVLAGLAATLVVAQAAHVAIPLPFTPVPFTLQPLAVLLVGLILGPLDGGLALTAYLAEGAAGLPVFSPTGPGGVLQLLGPTGGYLLAYPLVAALCGGISRLAAPRTGAYWGAVLGGLAAITVLFLCGAGWLEHHYALGGSSLWLAAVGPFLPGEIAKVFIAAGLFRAFPASFTRS